MKVSHDYKCDVCGKKAVYNKQNWWHLYVIDNGGEFKEINDWDGDTNEFYCKECYNEKQG